MSPKRRPNYSSETSNSPQEQQHFIYDGPNTEPEYDPDYVPEREFVLMPLFRRIGEMLGIRRHGEGEEQPYAPELVGRQTSVARPKQLSTPSARVDERGLASSAVMHTEVESPTALDSDVLGIEDELVPEPTASKQPEPVMSAEVQEPEWERVMTAPELQGEPQPTTVRHKQIDFESATAHMAEEALVAPMASGEERTVPPVELVATSKTRPQASPARPVLTQEDIAQLVAPITEAAREAATKISDAISQAAEWLHAKEEETLHRAELALESKRTGASQESLTDAPKWETDQALPVQREVALLETGGMAVAREEESRQGERKPVALKPRRPALWKRIDWAQEFTPKRVAVLGGVAMAMLIIAGVSLARRPASSVLPQETHAIQPGGVTLTTHSRATTLPAIVPDARQANPAPRRQAVAPAHSSKRAAHNNDDPDVVTHYYSKQKPSPAHQSTVAGVKHYSDM